MQTKERMKGGRKNLKRAIEEHNLTIQDGQSIMQVVSLQGSNLIEEVLLWLMKVERKRPWSQSGSKVTCIVSQVLFYEQVRRLQKSPEWPETFKTSVSNDSNENRQKNRPQEEKHELESTDDEGLPPLEANNNRTRPPEFQQSDPESDSGSDTDS